MVYTVERINSYDRDLHYFIVANGDYLSELFGGVFNYENAAFPRMAEKAVFLVGRKNGEIRGIHVSWLVRSPLDVSVKILQQQIFYVKPESGRMAFTLFQKFIDIGKTEANHIITMLTKHSNIKPSTLQRWGFNELEVWYRLEN